MSYPTASKQEWSPQEWANYISEWRESKKFFTPLTVNNEQVLTPVTDDDVMLGKLKLIVTEITEADEAQTQENLFEEFADAGIRILDILGTIDADVDMIYDQVQVAVGLFPSYKSVVNEISGAAEAVREASPFVFACRLVKALKMLEVSGGNESFWAEIHKKMEVNEGRPVLHEKLTNL